MEAGADVDVDLVAPERLTELLARAGRLPGATRVVGVERRTSRTTVVSQLEWLSLTYEGDAAGAPASLVLKMSRRDVATTIVGGGRNEAVFYREVAPRSPRDMLAECFDASTGSASAPSYVVLEDLSATHAVADTWPVPPHLDACGRLIDAFARFHACWWDAPGLGTSIGRFLDESAVPDMLADLERRWTVFRDMLGDRLSPERVSRYERFIRVAPRLLDRLRSRRDLTVVHGDAHVWNALHPRAAGATLRIIDWDAWRVGVGARDLAYMMALHWYPDRRRRYERLLLRRYHDALLAHGVAAYGWDALLDDYRRAALGQLVIPVWQATFKLPPAIWWSHLERAMLAFEDLGCEALLD